MNEGWEKVAVIALVLLIPLALPIWPHEETIKIQSHWSYPTDVYGCATALPSPLGLVCANVTSISICLEPCYYTNTTYGSFFGP